MYLTAGIDAAQGALRNGRLRAVADGAQGQERDAGVTGGARHGGALHVDGGSAEDSELELGSGSMISGFEEGVVGMSAGEEKTLNSKFPDDYHGDRKPTCYQCEEEVVYLFDDGRCSDCTRLTPEEVMGDIRYRISDIIYRFRRLRSGSTLGLCISDQNAC